MDGPACRNARRDSNPRPPSPVKLRFLRPARGGQVDGEASRCSTRLSYGPSGILHPAEGVTNGTRTRAFGLTIRRSPSELWPPHRRPDTSRRKPAGTPRPSRGVALFHTTPGRWTPRRPCALHTSLPRDNHPFASRAECPECKPPRPADRAGGAADARSRGWYVDLCASYAHATALPRWFLWSCPILRIHPILPAPSELPSRTSSPKCGASVNNGARGFTAHDGRVPGTANSAAGRALGARWVGECIILSGSFGSIGCGGSVVRRSWKQKRSRVWMPPGHGSRGQGPARASTARRMDRAGIIGTRLPRRERLTVGRTVVNP